MPRGLSNHGATTFLLDAETGRPAAILDATLLNRYRTAAADMVATDALAKAELETCALLGAGQQAA